VARFSFKVAWHRRRVRTTRTKVEEMKKPRWKQLAAVAGTAALIHCSRPAANRRSEGWARPWTRTTAEVQAKADAVAKAAESAAKEAESLALATEAYVYAYPLITMEMTRRVMTNVEKPEGTRAPMGQFVRARTYPDCVIPGRDGAERRTRFTRPPGSTCRRNPGS